MLHRYILAATLEGFVEVEAEVSEHDPQLLPPVGVLKLPDHHHDHTQRYYHGDDDGIEKYDDYEEEPEEIAGQLVLKSSLVIDDRHAA